MRLKKRTNWKRTAHRSNEKYLLVFFILISCLLIAGFSLSWTSFGNSLTGGAITVSPVAEEIVIEPIIAEPALPEGIVEEQAVITETIGTQDLGIQGTATSSACGTVDTDLTLTANIVTNTTCFTIAADNVVLDGAGFTITGNGSGPPGQTGTGVLLGGYNNITVKNLIINNFTIGIGDDSGADTGENSTFFNNTMNLNISNAVAPNGVSGFYLVSSVGLNVSYNTIVIEGNNSGGSSGGFFLNSINNSIFDYNVINASVINSGGSPGGITIFGSSNFNNITNNNITTHNVLEFGMRMLNEDGTRPHNNNLISGNNIITFGAIAITLQKSFNNIITGNNLTDYSNNSLNEYGTVMLDNANYTTIDSNTITAFNSSTRGIRLTGTPGSFFNNVTSNNVTSYFQHTLMIEKGGNNNVSGNILTGYPLAGSASIYVTASSNNILSSNTIYSYINDSNLGTVGAITILNSNYSIVNFNTINVYNQSEDGIVLQGASFSNLTSNTINSTFNGKGGINLNNADNNNNNISLNVIEVHANSASGIAISNSLRNIVDSNTINSYSNYSSANFGGVIYLSNTNSTLVSSNVINSYNQSSDGIYLQDGTAYNNFTSNNITVTGPSAVGIHLRSSGGSIYPSENRFLNNNITSSLGNEITDSTSSSETNYLIYSNTFGEIRWIASSFLQDLDLNSTLGIGLGINLFIGNNTAALNTSAFASDLSVNSSANITLYGVNHSSVDAIKTTAEYYTNSTNVSTLGTACTWCTKLSYASNTLIFNTTSFSSFAGVQDSGASPNSSNPAVSAASGFVNTTITLNATVEDDLVIDTVLFQIEPFGNVTASVSGSVATVTCNATSACNTTTVGSYNWTSIFLNDTAGNSNSTVLSLQFNITTTPTLNVTLVYPTANANFTWNTFTNFTVNVSCTIGNCGAINVSLDPLNTSGAVVNYTKRGDELEDDVAGIFIGSQEIPNLDQVSPGTFLRFTSGPVNNGSCWNISRYYNNDTAVGAGLPNMPILTISYGNLNGTVEYGDTFNIWTTEAECLQGYALKGGLVSTVAGATSFYTNTTNPYNLTLNENESVLVTWWVNATGGVGENHTFFVYANITSDQSVNAQTASINITIVNVSAANTAPNTTQVILNATSINNYTTNNLTCYANITDAGGGNVYANFTWYNNTVAHLSGQSSVFTQNTFGLISTLNSGNTTKGDNWTCSVNAYDGTAYETDWNNATQLTILNTAPSTTVNLTSDDSLNRTNGTLTGAWSYSDSDSDSQTANETAWYNNSVEVTSLANLTSIASANTTKGENWTFSVRVYDGTDWSTWGNSTNLTIANTIPNTAQVILNATSINNYTTDDLTCYANITDVDEGNIYANFTWYNNTVAHLSGQSSAFTQNTFGLVSTLTSGNTTKNENWICSVQAYDGTDYETDWNNATLTINVPASTTTTDISSSSSSSDNPSSPLPAVTESEETPAEENPSAPPAETSAPETTEEGAEETPPETGRGALAGRAFFTDFTGIFVDHSYLLIALVVLVLVVSGLVYGIKTYQPHSIPALTTSFEQAVTQKHFLSNRQTLTEQLQQVNLRLDEIETDKVEKRVESPPFDERLNSLNQQIKQLKQKESIAKETASTKTKSKPKFIQRIKEKLLEKELRQPIPEYAPPIIIKPAGPRMKRLTAELTQVSEKLEHLDETGKKVNVITVLPSISGHVSSSAAERKPTIIPAPKKDYHLELSEVDQKLANWNQFTISKDIIPTKPSHTFKKIKKPVLKQPKKRINHKLLARLKAELAQVEEELSKSTTSN